MAFSQADLNAIAAAQAANPSLPTGLLSAVATQETGGSANPDTAVSSTGAQGLFQILPSTASNPGFGVSGISPAGLSDPTTNANFAGSYLAGLIGSTGSVAAAISAYSGNSYTLGDLEAKNPTLGAAVSAQGVPSSSTGGAVPASGTGGAGGAVSNFLTPVWELLQRGAIIFFGIALVLVALIAMLLHSKTMETPVSALTEHA